MARYHLDSRFGASLNLAGTYKTLVGLTATGASPRRGRVVGIAVGAEAAPNATDCSIIYTIQRQTNTGLGPNTTPNPLVPGDAASLTFTQVNFTSEATYSLPIWNRPLNQRASMQWTAPDIDAALLWPATASAGLDLMALSTTFASIAVGGIEYEDL